MGELFGRRSTATGHDRVQCRCDHPFQHTSLHNGNRMSCRRHVHPQRWNSHIARSPTLATDRRSQSLEVGQAPDHPMDRRHGRGWDPDLRRAWVRVLSAVQVKTNQYCFASAKDWRCTAVLSHSFLVRRAVLPANCSRLSRSSARKRAPCENSIWLCNFQGHAAVR